MFKNRFILVLGVISLLSVTMAVSYPRSNASSAAEQVNRGSFLQHPEWRWRTTNQNVVIPLTGNNDAAFPDYYQRHPELTVPAILGLTASDYFQRHPELSVPVLIGLDASDYFQRHPELTAPAEASVDTTDYFFRHRELSAPGLACESPVDCR